MCSSVIFFFFWIYSKFYGAPWICHLVAHCSHSSEPRFYVVCWTTRNCQHSVIFPACVAQMLLTLEHCGAGHFHPPASRWLTWMCSTDRSSGSSILSSPVSCAVKLNHGRVHRNCSSQFQNDHFLLFIVLFNSSWLSIFSISSLVWPKYICLNISTVAA